MLILLIIKNKTCKIPKLICLSDIILIGHYLIIVNNNKT